MDRTADFRAIVKENNAETTTSRSKAPKKSKRLGVRRNDDYFSTKTFVVEALNILSQIVELSKTLAHIRRPYLGIGATDIHSSCTFDMNGSFEQWSGRKGFDEKERTRIDNRLGNLVTSLASKIHDLETYETRRIDRVAANINPVLRLLPARLASQPDHIVSDFIAAHHMGILWYLNRRLSQTNQKLKDMQEERLKRQRESIKTLGAGAFEEALAWRTQPIDMVKKSESSQWSDVASTIASTITSSYFPTKSAPEIRQFRPEKSIYRYDEDEQDFELTPSQISLFQQENSEMLQSMQDTLASVQQAESRLLDISALQMNLIAHLTHQTEITEQLYNDAVATSNTVEKGNTQLREAKKRAKDSRLFLLVFLFGASFALLFVHFY